MLQWSAEYDTGVASVDSDHKRLVQGLNELETALNSGAGSKQIDQLLAFLASYANEHFTREEACMSRLSCPTAQTNKAAHREFIAKFGAAKAKIEQSPNARALVALQVHRELCDWIVNHILRVDSALKQCRPAPVAGGATGLPRNG